MLLIKASCCHIWFYIIFKLRAAMKKDLILQPDILNRSFLFTADKHVPSSPFPVQSPLNKCFCVNTWERMRLTKGWSHKKLCATCKGSWDTSVGPLWFSLSQILSWYESVSHHWSEWSCAVPEVSVDVLPLFLFRFWPFSKLLSSNFAQLFSSSQVLFSFWKPASYHNGV